jgi:hypothetical protein
MNKKAIGCISCTGGRIGTAYTTGVLLTKIGPALSYVPIAELAVEVVGLALILFGNKWTQSTGVRWMTQKYQYYVLGEANVTTDNKVTEKETPNATRWFTFVLGVPIYDEYRIKTLCGADYATGESLNQPYSVRANNYLKYPEVIKLKISYADALNAAQIADQLQERPPFPGKWAQLPMAVNSQYLATLSGLKGTTVVNVPDTPVTSSTAVNTSGQLVPITTNSFNTNILLIAGAGIIAFSLLK